MSCPTCATEFAPSYKGQRFCSRLCGDLAELVVRRRGGDLNTLQSRFVDELLTRRCSISHVAAQITVSYRTLQSWLNRRNQRLSTKYVSLLAPWLGVTLQEALDLQGGTVEKDSRHRAGYMRGTQLAKPVVDNGLKRQVLMRVWNESLTYGEAASQIGMPRPNFSSWLRRKGGWLRSADVTRVALWLGISEGEGVRLQGGTAEEKLAKTAAAARGSDAFQQLRKGIEQDPAAWGQHLRKAHRKRQAEHDGKSFTFTQEHRQNLGQALRASRATNPVAPPTPTLHSRARQILGNVRRWHPDLSEAEAEDTAVQRLMGPPYLVGNEAAARALLAPRPKKRATHKGKGRSSHPRWTWIHERVTAAKTGRSRLPPLFWDEIESECLTREGPDAPRAGALRASYSRWKRPRAVTQLV